MNNVVTNRKIRAYVNDGGELIPIGGFMKGRALNVAPEHYRFKNCTKDLIKVLDIPTNFVLPEVYIIDSPVNISDMFQYQEERDEQEGAFERRDKEAAPKYLDYDGETEFFNAYGQWDDCCDRYFNHDSLLTDVWVYYNKAIYDDAGGDSAPAAPAGGDGAGTPPAPAASSGGDGGDGAQPGVLNLAQISALSKKARKAYKKALSIFKHQGGALTKQADAAQQSAFAGAVKSLSAPDSSGSSTSGGSDDGGSKKKSGTSPILIAGIATGAILLIVGAMFLFKGSPAVATTTQKAG